MNGEPGQVNRELWATRMGLVLAMAGNAVGLGNFLRFPSQAAQYGGGTFMIPYLIALLVLAMPLMWVEWGMGRFGGVRGHGTTPGIFPLIWKHPAAKYLGVLGVFLPTTICIYYIYVESWTLAYAYFSLKGSFSATDPAGMGKFLGDFLRPGGDGPMRLPTTAYIFFLITITLNVLIMYRGIAKGIEALAKVAMPLLFLFAIVLVVRVFTLGTPDPAHPDWNVWNGLAFLWNPDLSALSDGKIWLAAAGQVFFTLSIGFGAIQCYASYLKEKDDIALTGLSTAATNEFAEIILGSCIAIPLAVAFFGPDATPGIAKSGTFGIGFITMPIIFGKIWLGQLFGTLWFGLLFFAGITSSVALAQPAVTFLQDELKLTRQKSVLLLWGFIFLMVQFVIFGNGTIDELDYWAANLGIAIFGLIEIIMFMWVFGSKNAWAQITKGAQIKLPEFLRIIMTYVTPAFAYALLWVWTYQEFGNKLFMVGVEDSMKPWLWVARGMMVVELGLLCFLVWYSRRKEEG